MVSPKPWYWYTIKNSKYLYPFKMETGDGNCIGNGNKLPDENDALGNSRYMNQNAVAQMPTKRDASHYNMNHSNRGMALIFNHEDFEISGLKRRSGTNVDSECLRKQLEKLGFEVQVFNNLDYSELHMRVIAASNSNHSDYDCFIMAVLTHGEMGILYAKDTAYKPESLWTPFSSEKCPTLAGKPKLFFLQACQGDKLDGGITLIETTETDGYPTHSYRIPSQADFLIAYSTIPGYFSWRNTTRGSWFIQALCTEMQESVYIHDMLTILTFVCRRVAIDFESNTPDIPYMHLQKQIPCITTMLTRLLKFNKKGQEIAENEVTMTQDYRTKEKTKGGIGSIFSSKPKPSTFQVNY